MDIMAAVEKLNDLVDESDPDVDVPNSYHAYQTAEGLDSNIILLKMSLFLTKIELS